jgi:uncharacterized protein
MFWQIDGTNTSLLATVHCCDQTAMLLPPAAQVAVNQASQVIFESDPDDLNEMSLLMLPSDIEFDRLMSPAIKEAANANWDKLDLPQNSMERYIPILVSITLEVTNAAQAGYTQELGLEHQLVANVKKNGTRFAYLEKKADVFRALAVSPFTEQVAVLAESLNSGDLGLSKLLNMLAAWRATDLDYFERNLKEKLVKFPFGTDSLISERNKTWLPNILNAIREGIPTVVAVGALHCFGEDGIPRLLEREGYTVSMRRERIAGASHA